MQNFVMGKMKTWRWSKPVKAPGRETVEAEGET